MEGRADPRWAAGNIVSVLSVFRQSLSYYIPFVGFRQWAFMKEKRRFVDKLIKIAPIMGNLHKNPGGFLASAGLEGKVQKYYHYDAIGLTVSDRQVAAHFTGKEGVS